MHFSGTQHKQKGLACRSDRQAGFTALFFLVGILVIVMVAGGAYYFGTIRNKPEQSPTINQPVAQESPTISPTKQPNTQPPFVSNITPSPVASVTQAANIPSARLLSTTGWIEASIGTFSIKYPVDKYVVTKGNRNISLQPKGNTQNDFTNSPAFSVADDYKGDSRRQWYLDFYGYFPDDAGKNVFFAEKTLGKQSVLEVKLVNEGLPREIILSNGNTLIHVLIQEADLQLVETIVSTLIFK